MRRELIPSAVLAWRFSDGSDGENGISKPLAGHDLSVTAIIPWEKMGHLISSGSGSHFPLTDGFFLPRVSFASMHDVLGYGFVI